MQKRIFKIITFYTLLLLSLFACKDDSADIQQTPDTNFTEITANTVKGIVRVKLSEDQTKHLSLSQKSGNISSNVHNIDGVLNSIGALSFKRTFPKSSRFEARTKKSGLHLWYDITYDTALVSLDQVINNFDNLSEIDITEPIKRISNQKSSYKKFDPHPFSVQHKSAALSTSNYPFNDPGITAQWHYFNNGSVFNSEGGCDINLFNAWSDETGSKDVIVAIVDAGIDVDHEDLVDNIWINTSEKDGSLYADDDNNGYKDDVNGFNFVSNDGTITAEDHGTHVAGTIGAMNNNNTGVCGIAGGNGDTPGVRLMPCQVFETDEKGDEIGAQNFAEAIKYAADNGAVICQNSWGYEGESSLPASMKAAIDYFIKYAGMDENNNQEGPMAGGVVIFAAGNEGISTKAYPAMYNAVVAVASVGADYTFSYYSNYGNWVDITATGGTDTQEGIYTNWIASTGPNNGYVYMIGTSMACPHVSGVAALIVSKFGDDGFTPEQLKTRLYQGAVDIDDYNPGYIGKNGAGLINAAGALADANGIPPETVTDLTASVDRNKVTLSWSVGKDEDDFKPMGYKIYYAKSPISDEAIQSKSASLGTSSKLVGLANIGESISASLTGLDFTTNYYFRIVGYDVLSSFGEASNEVTATTESNDVPLITSNEGNNFELKSHETIDISFLISDPDGDSYSWTYLDESGGSSAADLSDGVSITIDALLVTPGTYSTQLKVVDQYDYASQITIEYTVLENSAPKIIETIESLYIGNPDQPYTLDLNKYFYDEDGESLNYALSYASAYVSSTLSNNTLTINTESYGSSTYSIRAYDARKEDVTISFLLMIRDDANEIDIYPNPVTDKIYIRMGENVDGNINVEIYNDNGVPVKNLTTDISTFSPAQADLSALASGQYLLKITYNNQEYVRNIVKL